MAALGRYRAALELAAELAGLDAANAQAARLVVFSHQRVGDALLAVGALPEAVTSYREALARAQGLRHDHPASLLLAFDEADNLNRLSHGLWSAGDRVAARDAWHAAVAVVRGLEGAAEPERRGALDGPLGAMTCCALFRKGADEGAAVELEAADSQGSPKVAAGVLGHRAWQALIEGRATDAAALAENALEIDPSQVWLNLTLAHGLLLSGRQEAALELYRRYANHPVTDLETFREAALADLSQLERGGVTLAQRAEVERALAPGAAR
jgi:tetratricopeptide (TPR) repeat protein